MCEVTVVHGAGKGKVMWSGPEIIVMIALDRKKSTQHVLLTFFTESGVNAPTAPATWITFGGASHRSS